ncbi:hypothetical protein [Sphaerisporangium flaviroseum]|uniref:hypothetical protein n=1 Tax=Sphaerisporangium flaviroseum TaxID=509199 RepID=UPI0031E62C1E
MTILSHYRELLWGRSHGPEWGASYGASPTRRLLVAFTRYSRDGSFAVLGANLRFIAVMLAGSVTGALLGGLLLGAIPDLILFPASPFPRLAILLISAIKLARHTPAGG